jgi:hypothetical protein
MGRVSFLRNLGSTVAAPILLYPIPFGSFIVDEEPTEDLAPRNTEEETLVFVSLGLDVKDGALSNWLLNAILLFF